MRKVRVSGREEQVMPVDGPVPLELLPPHAAAVTAAMNAATTATSRVRVTRTILPSD
jgi:hypothetical protein